MTTVLPPGFDSTYFSEPAFPIRRFTVAEYQRLGEAGILTEDDSVELLEGLIVPKMTKNPRHDATVDILVQLLLRLLPAAWSPRGQNVLLTSDSAPEPDVAVVRGQPQDYWTQHPTAASAALVIEVAESSLQLDRKKRHIYARAGIETYWIVDLNSHSIEVFTQPKPAVEDYQSRSVVPLAAPISFSLPEGVRVTLPLDTALYFA